MDVLKQKGSDIFHRAGGLSFFVSAIILGVVALFVFLLSAPKEFPEGSVLTIEEGASLSIISEQLVEQNIIRSSFLFNLLIRTSNKQQNLIAGEYFLERPKGTSAIARKLVQGEFSLDPIRVTIPEGADAIDIATLFAETFPAFDAKRFLELAQPKEGYLFPDTYDFFPNTNEQALVDRLERTFWTKLDSLKHSLNDTDYQLEDVVIMASIVEREAQTPESRRLIAGILWKRIELEIPLQVDVTFDYINGKNTFELTSKDLKIDSLYNTYRYAGLPPGPIGNPGIDSIEASLEPTESEYLYFLADRQNNVHYSRTFEEHKEKKAIYLN